MSNRKSKKKPISYANTVRRSTPLKIEEIPIIDWLKHYGLEDFHHTIFVEKHIVFTWFASPKDKYPYEYSHLLTNIKTNVDLLFSFPDSFKFNEAISFPTSRKLIEMVNDGIITQNQYYENQIENRLVKAFELLLRQKKEYKAMLSVFGFKPTKEKYNSTLVEKLEYLDHQKYISKHIFKNEIIDKLKLIKFDDLLHCKQTTFNLFLSLPIAEVKKYILYMTNKVVIITKGLRPSFTKSQFDTFIDNNESLKMFESCYNNYDLKYVRTSLKSNFDAKSLLLEHRMDLLEYIFNPSELIDSEVSEEIYATLFPDNDHIYIEKQFIRLNENIPKTIINDAFMKQNKKKIRVFFIQGHGAHCSMTDYKKKNRVDFQKVFGNIKKQIGTKYNANKLNVVSTQPVGRKSIFTIIILLNKILSSQYRNVFLQGLINANKLEHLRILENVVHMYFSYYMKDIYKNKDDDTLSEYLKKSKLKKNTSHIINSTWKFPKTEFTTSDIVNFVKYGYSYPPINTEFYFVTSDPKEGLIGIFELNQDNANDFINLDNKITSIITKDNKLKMGLKLNEVYDFKGDVPSRADEILKYNKYLKPKSSNIYTLEELMEHIYLVGDIKPTEHVIIFDNSCRGITYLGKPSKSSNTRQDLSKLLKIRLNSLRINSYEKSLDEELYGGGSMKNSKKTKKKKMLK